LKLGVVTAVNVKTVVFRDVVWWTVGTVHNTHTMSYPGRSIILLIILHHNPLGRSDTSKFGLRSEVSETLSVVSSGSKWGFSINRQFQQSASPMLAVVWFFYFQ